MRTFEYNELQAIIGGTWKQAVVDACQAAGILSAFSIYITVGCWSFWLGCKAAGDC